MNIQDELETLYDKYDASISKTERRKILEEILFLCPDDIDSMHRLVDLLPKNKQLEALLELKDKGLEIVYKYIDKGEDVYEDHTTRPYMFVLEDLLSRYEDLGDLNNAYQTIKTMMELNPGDNLGQRFHLVAYYIGQGKINDLEEFVKDCPDDYSVALTFSILFLKEMKKGKVSDFSSLFEELPYLYALISKEISLNKSQIDRIIHKIEMYRPRGFYECLIFYNLLNIYSNKEMRHIIFHLCAIYKDMPRLSLKNKFPEEFKNILYSMLTIYDNTYEELIKRLNDYHINKEAFEKLKSQLEKHNLIVWKKVDDKQRFYIDEATLAVAKMYNDGDYQTTCYLHEMIVRNI